MSGADARPPLRNKFGARRTWVEAIGRHFASKHEAEAALALWARQQAGEIANLSFQVRYPLRIHGELVCTYVADFTWIEHVGPGPLEYAQVVADAKGVRTPLYALKARLMKAIYGVEVVEL